MERTKYILTILLIFFLSAHLKAGYKEQIYQAYINNNVSKWKNVIDQMNKRDNKTNEFILEMVNYMYGYIAICIGKDMDEQAEKYLDMAEDYVDILEDRAYNLSMVNSYKSAFYGYRIGLNVLKAPFIGGKSVDAAERAIEIDKNNPYGYIQYGNSLFFRPEAFGGSKTDAIRYYKKAQLLMESQSYAITNDWNYLNLLTIIGKAYEDISDYQMAKAYYEKIKKIEPGFLWVNNELYPELIKKM